MLLLRIVVAMGGLTFLATGIGIFLSDRCRSVTWGSRGGNRVGNFTATCWDAVAEGGMSQGAAGLISVTAGFLILVMVAFSTFRSLGRRHRSADG